jgi:hypothetical protein
MYFYENDFGVTTSAKLGSFANAIGKYFSSQDVA